MKKWLDYQYKNQVKDFDWEYAKTPATNLHNKLAPHFQYIKDSFADETMPARFENVFTRPDYIKRTSATTDGDVSEEQFRAWLSEYFDLVSHHGHKYITDFGNSHSAIYEIVSNELGFDPATTKIRVQIEEPGHYFMMHMDRHKYQEWEVDDPAKYVYDKNLDFHKHSIYLILFNDWQHGQAIQMGNNFLQWKAGDAYNWNYRNVPHGTSNLGYETNFMMVVTGNKIIQGK
jgi:hypothetical protein